MSQEEMRLQLLSGDLKSGNLAWHSRLAEWTPISLLASVALLDTELSEVPDPRASSHYNAEREEQSARRRSSRRTPTERIVSPPKAPAAAPVRAESRPESDRGRRVRRSSSRERSPERSPSGFWGLLKTFFEN